MKFNPLKIASVLQFAYPLLIIIYWTTTFPALEADAQRFQGPPSYLPALLLLAVLCTALFVTACLLWLRFLAGWLITILLDGAVAIFFFYFAISDRSSRWPMPLSSDLIVVGICIAFAVIPGLLLSRSTLAYFEISMRPINKHIELSVLEAGTYK